MSQEEDSFKITSQERQYWIQIPNIVDDMGLSVYAFRLYAHIKRRAGDSGECWESTRNMAEHCKMGMGSVSRAKMELEKAGLITIETKRKPGGEYHLITIRDIWLKNMAAYSRDENTPLQNQSVPDGNGSVPQGNGSVPGGNRSVPQGNVRRTLLSRTQLSKSQEVVVDEPRAKEPKPKPATATSSYLEELALWFEKQSSIKGEEIDIELAKAAAEQWIDDIAKSGKNWRRKNYDCIRERYVKLEMQGNSKSKYAAYLDDTDPIEEEVDDIPDDEYQEPEPEQTFPKEDSILKLALLDTKARTWKDAFSVIGVNGRVQIGVTGHSVEEAEAYFGKTLENAFMKPVVFCEVAAA